MEYPQRWLREHKAITSAEGWRRPTTKELLKCQKGLDVTEPPKLTSVTITGVPATIQLSAENTASVTVSFTHVDAEYVPVSIAIDALAESNALISKVTPQPVNGAQEFLITGGLEGEKVTFQATIDSVKSNIMIGAIKLA